MNDVMNELGSQPTSNDDKNWAVIAHLSSVAGLIIPFGNVVGPLVVMLTKGKDSDIVGDQAREALNFQISMTIAFLVSMVLMFVLIGFLLMPLIGIADLVFVIIAAVSASKGERYRYPLTLRLIN
jgi:uncharacterized Tic20 family protein